MEGSRTQPPTEKLVFQRPSTLRAKPTHYCPGCSHGVVHRLLAEVIDELGLREQVIGVCPVGCSVLMHEYVDVDFAEAAHGRASAVATGIKRVRPDITVFAYQGDGDLAAIGMAETVHTAARGENITVIFINNAIYGMTGGQLAPTTLQGQRTASTPEGRDLTHHGHPLRVVELLASQDGPAYLARVAVNTSVNIAGAKAAIKKAFRVQQAGLGFSLVEVLCACPVNWGLKPVDALQWVGDHMIPYYPLGEYRAVEDIGKIAA
jgi:2-oxoglutarate ferredoxin oxidoreductase subunit beta